LASIQGTNVQAPIVPNDSNDVFASHLAHYGQGGLRTVENLSARDAITLERREWLMEVNVLADGKKYQLKPGTDLADNTNWQEVVAGAGASAGPAVTEWAAGAQKANSLVTFNGNLYRVKQDISNGQSNPENNTQYYQLITVPAPDVTKAYVDAADTNLQTQLTTLKNTRVAVGNWATQSTTISVEQNGYYYYPAGSNKVYKRIGPNATVTTNDVIFNRVNWQLVQGYDLLQGFSFRVGQNNAVIDNDSTWFSYSGTGSLLFYGSVIVAYNGNSYRYIATPVAAGYTLTSPTDFADTSKWKPLTYSTPADTNKTYVDAGDASLQSQITNDVVHKTGNESIIGIKSFSNVVAQDIETTTTYKIGGNGTPAITYSPGSLTFGSSSIIRSTFLAGDYEFYTGNGGLGMRLAVNGDLYINGTIKAPAFSGDGSQLTNLSVPAPVTIEQDLTSNSTTSVPSVAAAATIIQYYTRLSDFPATGNQNTLYAVRNANKLYRWDGAAYQEFSKLPVVQTTGQSTTNVMSQTAVTTAINNIVFKNISFASLATPQDSGTWYRFNSTTDKEFTIYSEGNSQTQIGNHYFLEQVDVGVLTIVPRPVNGLTLPAPTLTIINCNSYTDGIGSILHLMKVASDSWIMYPVNKSVAIGNGFTTTAIKSTVTAGTFASGELQGTQPAGSTNGMKFTDQNYRYEYTFAAADTTGSTLVWTRTIKA
jgi:hypothetical protein